ncbi:hypothetical protein YC2023_023256 [Brassica napus]
MTSSRKNKQQHHTRTLPTATKDRTKQQRSTSIQTDEESNHRPRASLIKETTSGTRKSRRPTMPSFSSLRRRLPPPLHSTRTVYTHLTTNPKRIWIGKRTTPPEETKPTPRK